MEGGGFFIDDTPRTVEPSTSNKRPVAPQAQPSRPEEVDYTANLGDSRNGCSRCTSLSFSEEFLSVFGVVLCNACRRQEKLISKAAAKKQYCLTDGDLAKLGSVKRNNPHRKDWQPMRLYLEDQVQKVSYKKYGGFQGLESHARAMLDQRLKTKLEQREKERAKEGKEEEQLRRIRQKLEGGAPLAPATLQDNEVEDI